LRPPRVKRLPQPGRSQASWSPWASQRLAVSYGTLCLRSWSSVSGDAWVQAGQNSNHAIVAPNDLDRWRGRWNSLPQRQVSISAGGVAPAGGEVRGGGVAGSR